MRNPPLSTRITNRAHTSTSTSRSGDSWRKQRLNLSTGFWRIRNSYRGAPSFGFILNYPRFVSLLPSRCHRHSVCGLTASGGESSKKLRTTWCNFVEKRTISNTSIRDLLLSTPPTTPPPLHHRTTATTKSIQEQESSAENTWKPVYCGGLLRLKNKTLNISSMVQIVLCLKNTPQHFSIPFLLSLFVVTTVWLSSLCKGSKVKTREVSWKSKWKLFFSLLKATTHSLRNIYIITYHSYRDGPCYQLNLKQIFLTLENKVSDTKHCKIIMSCYTFIFRFYGSFLTNGTIF